MALPSNPSPADTRVPLSHVVTDPIWSLRCWSVDVTLGPLRGSIPALCAADWLSVLMQEPLDLFDVVPGMCPGLEEPLVDALLAGTIPLAHVKRAGLDALSAVTGRPWWFAMRLIKTAVASWEVVGGELAFRNVDAERLSLSAWLDAVLFICLRSMEQSKVSMFMSQLEAPPPEEMEHTPELTMTTNAFLSLGA